MSDPVLRQQLAEHVEAIEGAFHLAEREYGDGSESVQAAKAFVESLPAVLGAADRLAALAAIREDAELRKLANDYWRVRGIGEETE